MELKGVNPDTGEEMVIENEGISEDFIASMSKFKMSDENIRRMIDNLNVSADVKALLYSLSKATIQAGQYILKIGRKIIDFICTIFQEYPNATFGLIFGAIAGVLIGTIPLIGFILGPIVLPITAALGMFAGFNEDLRDKAIEREIAKARATFDPLKA